jgi:hypothetical protein
VERRPDLAAFGLSPVEAESGSSTWEAGADDAGEEIGLVRRWRRRTQRWWTGHGHIERGRADVFASLGIHPLVFHHSMWLGLKHQTIQITGDRLCSQQSRQGQYSETAAAARAVWSSVVPTIGMSISVTGRCLLPWLISLRGNFRAQ